MKNKIILDTNVLLHDPNCINTFENTEIYIPLVVIEELDKHKNRLDLVGKNSRFVIREIDKLRNKGNLFNGVMLDNGSMLQLYSLNKEIELPHGMCNNNDNIILQCALSIKKEFDNIKLITKDLNLRLKCDAVNIQTSDYNQGDNVNIENFYSGISKNTKINSIEYNENLDLDQVTIDNDIELFPNQIIEISKNNDINFTYHSYKINSIIDNKIAVIDNIKNYENVHGLSPKSSEQRYALDMLLDTKINLVTLVGQAGVGKTLLALAAGLEQLKLSSSKDNGIYEKIVILRPIQPLGKDIGYLPGMIEEKLEPWMQPIKDNIQFLSSRKRNKRNNGDQFDYYEFLKHRGSLEVEALTFIRGRSISNSFIIVDECQNLTMHELKTILTRAGEGTKIVLTGDIHQIDNNSVDIETNALTYAVEKFKNYNIAAHITLKNCERSKLAALASDILL